MKSGQPLHDTAFAAQSLIDWWTLAGVDCAVDEQPRAWRQTEGARGATHEPTPQPIDRPAPAAGMMADAPDTAARSAPRPLSPPPLATLDAYLAWLAESADHPEAAFAPQWIMPHGVKEADVVMITDMPSAADMAAGQLFSGDEGDLARNMLRALGIDAQACGMASLLLARPPGGMGDDTLWPHAAERARHLLRLANPRLVLLFGDRTKRALCGANRDDPGASDGVVDLGDREIRAIPMPAAFIMLQQPERKAAAWKDLRRVAGAR